MGVTRTLKFCGRMCGRNGLELSGVAVMAAGNSNLVVRVVIVMAENSKLVVKVIVGMVGDSNFVVELVRNLNYCVGVTVGVLFTELD